MLEKLSYNFSAPSKAGKNFGDNFSGYKTQTMTKEEAFNQEFLKQFKNGEELFSFLHELQKRGVEAILEGEMDNHLGYEKSERSDSSNARNGHSKKKLRNKYGEIEIQVPRDREGSFDPLLVPKRKNIADGVENVIVSMYAKGMSVRDIERQIAEIYDFEISTSAISRITDRVSQDALAWQNRPLDGIYCVVWMDGIVFKVREDHRVIDKTVYLVLGLRQDGLKEVLGIWLGQKESASFWMSVLTDLKARGVKDILITATDNLKGFTQAIASVFPESTKQICIVHQIRNACKYVSWKDRRPFTQDMKEIYSAPNEQAALQALEVLREKWEAKYGYAIKSWQDNWSELTAFLHFPLEMRKIIYTTNVIENLNGKIRKYTKNKLSFPSDEAVMKSVYLAIHEATRTWTLPIKEWGTIYNQFIIMFDNRLNH